MYNLDDLAKVTQDEQKRRAAARHQLRGQAYAARRAGNPGGSARRASRTCASCAGAARPRPTRRN